jgi:hypothetical protein
MRPHSLIGPVLLLALSTACTGDGDTNDREPPSASGASSSAGGAGSGNMGHQSTGGEGGAAPGAVAGQTNSGGNSSMAGSAVLGGSGGSTPDESPLDTAVGCSGVFNPDQVLEYRITLPPGDWEALLADSSYSIYFEAQVACGNEPPMTMGIQRKRSGGSRKVGLKLDTNHFVAGQEFHGLRKLGFENGVSSGSATDDAGVENVLSEYLAWRLMQRAEVMSSRAAIARVIVNDGEPLAYAHVEQVDKRFLKSRLGEDDGWLYKKSGGDGDGLKTHELDGLENPGADYFCFWIKGGGSCAIPPAAALADTLPERLAITQLLRLGAVNALLSNSDSPLFKDNNYYYYDDPTGRRTYFPWDLDTTTSGAVHVLDGGVPGGTTMYTDALFSNWKAEYVAELKLALSNGITPESIASELDRALEVAGATLDGDPYLDGSTAAAVESLGGWWSERFDAVAAQLE